MGSRIAAHFANAGIASVLLDLSKVVAQKGVETAIKQRPGAFFVDASAAMITTGSFDDDLDKVAQCDWIIEAVTENLEIKRSLWGKVEKLRKPHSIVSTNTSGIPLHSVHSPLYADYEWGRAGGAPVNIASIDRGQRGRSWNGFVLRREQTGSPNPLSSSSKGQHEVGWRRGSPTASALSMHPAAETTCSLPWPPMPAIR